MVVWQTLEVAWQLFILACDRTALQTDLDIDRVINKVNIALGVVPHVKYPVALIVLHVSGIVFWTWRYDRHDLWEHLGPLGF